MDAIEFIETIDRICKEYDHCCDCPINNFEICGANTDAKEFVSVVDEWARVHPVKTRQSEFLKLFPNAKLDDSGVIEICCKDIDTDNICDANCKRCRETYWSEESE